MEVKPNFLPIIPAPGTGSGGYALFAGRLSSEKGLRNLLEAWKNVKGLPLKIAGDGPLREELQSFASMHNLPIEFLGYVSYAEVLALTGDAVFLVVPSEWYEGFPMVVVQALACGTPVIASRLGSLDEIVEEGKTGLKFEAGNPQDLAIRVNELASDRSRVARMRIYARAAFEERYTAKINYFQLMEIYQSAIGDFRGQKACTTKREAGFLLGIHIDRDDLDSMGTSALSAIEGRRSSIVFACANPHSLVVAQSDRVSNLL